MLLSNWGGHTISDKRIPEEEARVSLDFIKKWEAYVRKGGTQLVIKAKRNLGLKHNPSSHGIFYVHNV